jgi:ATP-binding cassette subfamily B protein
MVLGWVLVLYVLASLFGWAQGYVLNGVTQRTVYRLPRGRRGEDPPPARSRTSTDAARELLSRVTERHRQHLARRCSRR